MNLDGNTLGPTVEHSSSLGWMWCSVALAHEVRVNEGRGIRSAPTSAGEIAYSRRQREYADPFPILSLFSDALDQGVAVAVNVSTRESFPAKQKKRT